MEPEQRDRARPERAAAAAAPLRAGSRVRVAARWESRSSSCSARGICGVAQFLTSDNFFYLGLDHRRDRDHGAAADADRHHRRDRPVGRLDARARRARCSATCWSHGWPIWLAIIVASARRRRRRRIQRLAGDAARAAVARGDDRHADALPRASRRSCSARTRPSPTSPTTYTKIGVNAVPAHAQLSYSSLIFVDARDRLRRRPARDRRSGDRIFAIGATRRPRSSPASASSGSSCAVRRSRASSARSPASSTPSASRPPPTTRRRARTQRRRGRAARRRLDLRRQGLDRRRRALGRRVRRSCRAP